MKKTDNDNTLAAQIAAGFAAIAEDITDLSRVRAEVERMAQQAAGWLERQSLYAKTVTLKVRYADFTTITRSHSAALTRDGAALAARAVELLRKTDAGERAVRLLGVSVHNFATDLLQEPTGPGRLPFEETD